MPPVSVTKPTRKGAAAGGTSVAGTAVGSATTGVSAGLGAHAASSAKTVSKLTLIKSNFRISILLLYDMVIRVGLHLPGTEALHYLDTFTPFRRPWNWPPAGHGQPLL